MNYLFPIIEHINDDQVVCLQKVHDEVINLISKKLSSQSSVDKARILWGGATWNYRTE